MNKIENCNMYTYNEGALNFLYYPLSGMVKCTNSTSVYRAVEHFSRRKFEINWTTSNIIRKTLFVSIPKHLTEEEGLAVLSLTKESLYAQEFHDKEEARAKLILNNVDNKTGLPISEDYLITTSRRMKTDRKKTREDVAKWFDSFNLELIRPDLPTMTISTKSKGVLIEEGRKLIYQLFEQGRLIRYTKEEYLEKLSTLETRKELVNVEEIQKQDN